MQNKLQKYNVIGLMSGSSLDGLDIAYCEFTKIQGQYKFEILQTDVVEFSTTWIEKLKVLTTADAKTIWHAHAALGTYFGTAVAQFITKYSLQSKVDFVASHGHTIFHFPSQKFTTQIGDGAALAVACGLPVLCDFRTADIAQGGQGTPIVPIGDKLLFAEYKYCLNIGGIANISCKTGNQKEIVAFDVCVANQILNVLALQAGKPYDDGGKIAASGTINQALLIQLNNLPYFSAQYPKSLDNSFSQQYILPVLKSFNLSVQDTLRTFTEHIAFQIGKHIQSIVETENMGLVSNDKMLISGGGAFNTFLIKRIAEHAKIAVIIPDEKTIKFKEALVIALMGVLRINGDVNVLKSVTGAYKNTCGGAIYLP